MTDTEGIKPSVRVSDADRDAVVSELGTHFQDGRLDRDELDQRIGAAIGAKTRADLDLLLTDLPALTHQAGAPASPPGDRRPRLRLVPLVPVLALAIAFAAASAGWHHHEPWAPFGFLWLIGPALAFRFWFLGGRRQWR